MIFVQQIKTHSKTQQWTTSFEADNWPFSMQLQKVQDELRIDDFEGREPSSATGWEKLLAAPLSGS